jgi:hypothetical protein
MNPLQRAVRVVTNTSNAATAAAGAIGGAAVNGVIGGVQGTAQGIRNGVANGSHSTPAAALTFAALGATGLVEWPVLLTGLGPSGGPIDIGHINDIADIDAGPQHPGHEVTGQEVTGQEVTGQEVTGQEGDREAKPGAQGDESPSLEPPTDLTQWM